MAGAAARLVGPGIGEKPPHAAGHFGGGSPGERQQQDASWVGPRDDEMRHAMGEGVGLARAGTGDDQERRAWLAPRDAMDDGGPLGRVERIEIRGDLHAAQSKAVTARMYRPRVPGPGTGRKRYLQSMK